MILTEVHPPENRVYRGIGNFAKKLRYDAQYIPVVFILRLHYILLGCPHIFENGNEFYLLSAYASLASLPDLQFGILHAEDKGNTTAYSSCP